MRRIPLAGMALVFILTGCDPGTITGFEPRSESRSESHSEPHSEPQAQFVQHFAHQGGKTAVPLYGRCDLEAQRPQPIGPGLIRQVDVGRCVLAHLGRSTMVSDKVINLIAGTQTTEIVIVAANGDVLHASGAGTNTMIAPGRVAFRVELAFTGGTGRFDGVSGEAVSEGEADLGAATATLRMIGWLRY